MKITVHRNSKGEWVTKTDPNAEFDPNCPLVQEAQALAQANPGRIVVGFRKSQGDVTKQRVDFLDELDGGEH